MEDEDPRLCLAHAAGAEGGQDLVRLLRGVHGDISELTSTLGVILHLRCTRVRECRQPLHARSAARRIHTAVRLAMGATRMHIVTPALVERVLLITARAGVPAGVGVGDRRHLRLYGSAVPALLIWPVVDAR